MSELARRAKAQVEALEARVARLEVDKPDIVPEPDDITG
jgi:hypothetical protein